MISQPWQFGKAIRPLFADQVTYFIGKLGKVWKYGSSIPICEKFIVHFQALNQVCIWSTIVHIHWSFDVFVLACISACFQHIILK